MTHRLSPTADAGLHRTRTRSMSRWLGTLLLLSGVALHAAAQTAYRCGPEGNVYSPTPCPGGRPVDIADARTPEQRQHAAEAARREAQLGQRLADERVAREATTRPAGATGIRGERSPAPSRPASAPAKKGHHKKEKRAGKKSATPPPSASISQR